MEVMEAGRKGFHIVDYIIFAVTMLVSLGIGVYFAIGGRNQTNEEYLMGNRGLSTIPVAISMLVTFVTAVGMMGAPAEMYAFGTQFVMHIIAASLGCIYGAVLFVPLLYPLKLTSAFEYFELRFRSTLCKLVGSIITLLNIIFMNGTGLFAPSMALEAVTGFPIWISIVICGVVTTTYTSIGGMKAVIWTDVFQSVIILGGLIAVCVMGVIKVGGFQAVWDLNDKWDRIEFFNFDPDPRERVTFWSIVVMMSILWMCMTVAQPAVQRYCSLPSMTKAKIAVLLNIPGFVIVGILACFGGVVAFAYYAKMNCDPMTGGHIANPNQILPYFVMDVLGYPGLPGVFVACLYSGALSTISSSLNAAAAITWEDLLKWKFDYLPERKKTIILKFIAVLYGIASLGMGFAMQHMPGTFVQIVFSVLGTTLGPVVGMYFLGATVPAAGPIGALIGVVFGLTISVWMAIGAYVKMIHSRPLPLPYEGCANIQAMIAKAMAEGNGTDVSIANSTMGNSTYSFNSTSEDHKIIFQQMMAKMMPPPPELHGIEHMYAVSYLWYPVVGIVLVMLMGIITSCIPGLRQPNRTPKELLFPVLRPFARCCQRYAYADDYDDKKYEKPNQLKENLIYRPPDANRNYKDAQNGKSINDKLLVDSRESNM